MFSPPPASNQRAIPSAMAVQTTTVASISKPFLRKSRKDTRRE